MDLVGPVAGRRRRRRAAPRRRSGSTFDDDDWARRRRARPLADRTPRSPTPTARCSTARRFELDPPGAGRAPLGDVRRASSTRPTSGSTAPTSATPRATSSPTASTSPSLSRLGDEHVLAVEVDAARPQRDQRGEAQHHRACSSTGTASTATWNPGGLWRPVRIDDTGPVRIDRLRVLCRDADDTARPRAPRTPASTATSPARCASARRVDGERRRPTTSTPLAAGVNEVEWTLDIDQPAPVVAVVARRPAADRRRRRGRASTASSSDRRARRTGLREVALQRLGAARSTASGCSSRAPTSARPGRRSATPRRTSCAATSSWPRGRARPAPRARPHRRPRAVRRRRRARRCWSGRTSRCSGATPARCAAQAVRQAREAVDLLGHHPSIVLWCAHNEPVADRRRRRGRPAPVDGCATSSASSCRRGTDDPRPLGQAGVRAGRRDPPGDRPLAA